MATRLLVIAVLATSLVVGFGTPAFAATPTFVQTSSSTNDGYGFSINTTFGSSNTAGNLIVAAVSWGGSGTLTCTDIGGNSYTTTNTRYDSTNDQSIGVCWAANVAAGPNTLTASFSGNSAYRRVIVHEYSGILTTSPVDVSADNIAAATLAANNVTSTAATTTTAGDLIFGAVMDDSGTTSISAGSGFTQRDSLNGKDLATQDLVQSSAGSIASTQTFGATDRYLAVMVAFKPLPSPSGHPLTSSSLTLSDSQPSATANYDFVASNVTTSTIRCIRLEFDTAADGSGTIPAGMNIASATVNAATNFIPTYGSWNITNTQSTGIVTLTNASGETPASASSRHISLNGIVNPSSATTRYLIVRTYNNTNCVSSMVDETAVAFATTSGTSVSVTIDPSLTFTVAGRSTACNGQTPTAFVSGATGTAVSLGHLDASKSVGGAQDLSISTNAGGGFMVYARSMTAPNSLSDGNGHSIADISGTHAAPGSAPTAGSAGFGYTTNDTSTGFGSNQFAKLTTTNDSVLVATAGVLSKSSCVGYQAAVDTTTVAGSYSASVIYTALPIF